MPYCTTRVIVFIVVNVSNTACRPPIMPLSQGQIYRSELNACSATIGRTTEKDVLSSISLRMTTRFAMLVWIDSVWFILRPRQHDDGYMMTVGHRFKSAPTNGPRFTATDGLAWWSPGERCRIVKDDRSQTMKLKFTQNFICNIFTWSKNLSL